jgi:membrane protease YdiL (CAAX protease family)
VNLSYGIASLLVLGAVYGSLSPAEREAVFIFDRPSAGELGATLAFLPLGIVAFLGASVVTGMLGFELGGTQYTLADPVTVGAVVFGTIVVAPVVEEILFRGLVLGSLLGRGVSPPVAGAASILAFGVLHVALLGVAGVVTIAIWAIFPTLLRLRYDNLTGAWLLHAVNNVWGNIVVVALGFA